MLDGEDHAAPQLAVIFHMNAALKKCPYCKKENSLFSRRCECGYFFDLVDYQKHSKEKVNQPFYLTKKFIKPVGYILNFFRVLLFLFAILCFGIGLLALLQGGIAEPFSKETMIGFCAVMFSPMAVFIIIELMILKAKRKK